MINSSIYKCILGWLLVFFWFKMLLVFFFEFDGFCFNIKINDSKGIVCFVIWCVFLEKNGLYVYENIIVGLKLVKRISR